MTIEGFLLRSHEGNSGMKLHRTNYEFALKHQVTSMSQQLLFTFLFSKFNLSNSKRDKHSEMNIFKSSLNIHVTISYQGSKILILKLCRAYGKRTDTLFHIITLF